MLYLVQPLHEELCLSYLSISNLTTIARRIPQAIAEVISMLPALDESKTVFVAHYKTQLLARCDRYLSFAAEVREV